VSGLVPAGADISVDRILAFRYVAVRETFGEQGGKMAKLVVSSSRIYLPMHCTVAIIT
jgi:hypothetical protein